MQQQADIAKKAEEIANNAGADKPKPRMATVRRQEQAG